MTTPPNEDGNEAKAWACVSTDGKAPSGNPNLGYGISCYGPMEEVRRIKEALSAKDAEHKAEIAKLEEENRRLKEFFRLVDEEGAKFTVADSKLVISLEAKIQSLQKVVEALRLAPHVIDCLKFKDGNECEDCTAKIKVIDDALSEHDEANK